MMVFRPLLQHTFLSHTSCLTLCAAAATKLPSALPTGSPSVAPTSHPCDGTDHGCHNITHGGICVKTNSTKGYKCECSAGYYCSKGCTGNQVGHTCTRSVAPSVSPTTSPTTTSPTATPTTGAPTKRVYTFPPVAAGAMPKHQCLTYNLGEMSLRSTGPFSLLHVPRRDLPGTLHCTALY